MPLNENIIEKKPLAVKNGKTVCSFSYCNLKSSEVRQIAEAFRSEFSRGLTVLDFSSNVMVEEDMRYLSPAIACLKNLQSLVVRRNEMDAGMMSYLGLSLSSLSNLHSLSLSLNQINTSAMFYLSLGLGRLGNL